MLNESISDYNAKVRSAIAAMQGEATEVRIIKAKGRAQNENGVVLINQGVYRGYGFIDDELEISTLEDIEAFIIPQKNTLETERIIQAMMPKVESFLL